MDNQNENNTISNTEDKISEKITENSFNSYNTTEDIEPSVNISVFPDSDHYEYNYSIKSKTPIENISLISKKKKNHFFSPILLMFLVVLIGLSIGIGSKATTYYIDNLIPEKSYNHVTNFEDKTPFVQNEYSIVDIANVIEPSVVSLTNFINTNNANFSQEASGSGVIFDKTDKKIYILTNNHVIDNSSELYVTFFNSEPIKANVIGFDAETDLAVVTVLNSDISQNIFNNLKVVSFGDSDKIQVGETAIAIGNPLGYNNTVTVGIVSALDRSVNSDLNSLSLIQTDAAINPGNSGGALINIYGQLIGINTIKISDTAVEGIGFAIPINSAIPILEELLEKGYVSKPFIGIWGVNVTDNNATKYDIPKGVVVTEIVKNSPASESKLQVNDIIIKIGYEDILTMNELIKVIKTYSIGDSVSIQVQRENNAIFEMINIELIIGDRSDF